MSGIKDQILKWIFAWLISNLDKAFEEKLMKQYILPWIAKEKEYFYAMLDNFASDDAKWKDFVVQMVKWILDDLLPKYQA